MSEGVSWRVVGRDVGLLVSEKGLFNKSSKLLLDEEDDELEDEELLLLPPLLSLASKLGLHKNASSSNFLQASCHFSPVPGGFHPKKVGELQYGSVRHSYQSLYCRT